MSKNESGIIQVKDIPTYDNTGTVVIMNPDSIIFDEFSYSEDLHFELLDLTDGVSLERTNPDISSADPSNWHSASEFVGFATPAYKNSQFREITIAGSEEVFIEPIVFSPDNDGMADYVYIRYKFDNPGFVANIYLFDVQGRLLEQMSNNVLLATEGSVEWDGVLQTGERAPAGIYIVYFEAFDLQGNVKKFKKTFTLASKF